MLVEEVWDRYFKLKSVGNDSMTVFVTADTLVIRNHLILDLIFESSLLVVCDAIIRRVIEMKLKF